MPTPVAAMAVPTPTSAMNDDAAVAAPAPAAMNDNDGVLDEVLRRRDETLVNRERRGFRRTRLQSQPKRGHCGGA